MKPKIENLKAQMRGVKLDFYQKGLALDEFYKLIDYVTELEKLSQPLVSGSYKGKSKPQLEDFYDTSDPRGCSSSEYNDYQNAVYKWEVDNNYH
jgi:hypothetical protein